jgi:hypothetical protein
MVYDVARGRCVLFGGLDTGSSRARDETWEWDGTRWDQRSPAVRPAARFAHAMAYDSARGRTVLFGGRDEWSRPFGDTWEWDGTVWTRLFPVTGPTPSWGRAMTYDSWRNRTLLYDGQTWEWDGANWTQRFPNRSPGHRPDTHLSFDSARGRAVLFGGRISGYPGTPVADTWEWDGTDWTLFLPPRYPEWGRYGHTLVYDVDGRRTLLFGGFDFGGNDLWAWDGTYWTPVPADPRPGVRAFYVLAYDIGRQQLVLSGGAAPQFAEWYDDTWEWNRTAWTLRSSSSAPTVRHGHAMAHDSARGRTVVMGGSPVPYPTRLTETWEWDGAQWMLTPGTLWRVGHATAYDARRGRTVLLGGSGDCGFPCAETSEWDGSTWSRRAPPSSPPARIEHAMAFDAARGVTVLFGGAVGASATPAPDTWEWNGTTWSRRSLTASPPARRGHGMACDTARGVVVLFGGWGAGRFPSNDTWEYDGTTWTRSSPATSPPARERHALVYDTARRRTILFGGETGPGGTALADTWEWDGTTWTPLATATSPPPRSAHAMAFDPARRRVVLFGGWDGRWALSDAWELISGSGPAGPGQLPLTVSGTSRIGTSLCLAFPAAGVFLAGLGSSARPPLPAGPPLFCAPGVLHPAPPWVLLPGAGNPATLCLTLPPRPELVGTDTTFQGVAIDGAGCLRPTDAVGVTVLP